MIRRRLWLLLVILFCRIELSQQNGDSGAPRRRVLLDAHNCYPYSGWWNDRIDRALSTGVPLAIEQDLSWYTDPKSGRSWSILSHGEPVTGAEPTLKDYFFERVRPVVEKALKEGDRGDWPVITLNLDFKDEKPEHFKAILDLLRQYRDWITTAPRSADIHDIRPLLIKPLLVLTGESDAQRIVFHDQLDVGSPLLVFGATRTHSNDPASPPSVLAPEPRDNYHRWWNNAWRVIEPLGQNAAGNWTPEKEARLRDLVSYAHRRGFWIRFYTLDGETSSEESARGLFHSYNFGSLEIARVRWAAAIRAGVDFVAVDQYEDFAAELHRNSSRNSTITLQGTITGADNKSLIEREFDVPAGIRSLKISLSYTGNARRTVIDLGLRGPEGFRGWSGGGEQTIHVGPTFASYGYLAGPIEAGHWAVILGIPNIRENSSDMYTITIDELDHEDPIFPAIRREPGWYVGDFHSHSGHSDGRANVEGQVVRIPPHRIFDAAQRAGLDFIALTDHNTTSHWTDVERLQPYYSHLLLLHAREVTTYNGHMNAFGERGFVDFRVGTNRGVNTMLDELTARGAFVSINHPLSPGGENCMGCRWTFADPETMQRVSGVEIVNGGSSEGLQAGWPFWVKALNSGLHLTAIGGSDDHTADETVSGAIGVPATVVYADTLSEPDLIEGLRKGRAYIRTRGVAGPGLQFEARSGTESWQMGGTVPGGVTKVTLSARVTGASGQRLEWIRNGETLAMVTLDGKPAQLDVNASPGDWFSIVVRDSQGPTLFSNAIYVARRDAR